MAHYLMVVQRSVEDLYEDNQLIMNELLLEERIRDISNNIRIMVNRRREAILNQQRIRETLLYFQDSARQEGEGVRPPAELRPRNYPYNNRKPTINTNSVSLFALNTPCNSQCAICYEIHKKIDSLTTDCNHEFGKACYNEWVSKQNSCPICRNVCQNVTVYNGRSRRKNNVNVDV